MAMDLDPNHNLCSADHSNPKPDLCSKPPTKNPSSRKRTARPTKKPANVRLFVCSSFTFILWEEKHTRCCRNNLRYILPNRRLQCLIFIHYHRFFKKKWIFIQYGMSILWGNRVIIGYYYQCTCDIKWSKILGWRFILYMFTFLKSPSLHEKRTIVKQ